MSHWLPQDLKGLVIPASQLAVALDPSNHLWQLGTGGFGTVRWSSRGPALTIITA